MRNGADNLVPCASGGDPESRGWLAPALVCLTAWTAALAAALSVGGWSGATIGLAACLGLPAIWLFGEILFNQD